MPLLCASLLAALSAVRSDAAGLRERLRGPRVAGHQGSLYGAKNSLRGFEEAFRAGADVVEMDLRLSKDGVPMVFHDERLELWTRCFGAIADKTAGEIRACRYRGHGDAVPAFAEVLDWSAGKIVVNAEFKTLDVIGPALELVRRRDAYDWVYFQTQDSALKYHRARSLDSRVALQFQPATRERLRWALERRDPNLLVIELNELTDDEGTVRAVHRANRLSSTNSWRRAALFELTGEASCDWVFARGIDVAVTNRPASCARQRGKAASRSSPF